MKIILLICSLFISRLSFSQNCEKLFLEDKFTKDKKALFFLEGIEDYKPFVLLTVEVSGDKAYSDETITIELSAGSGKIGLGGLKDYSSLTMKGGVKEKNNLLLYFLFEDGKSLYLTGSPNVVYSNSVFFYRKLNSELLSYLKTKKLTDIRFVFNNIQADYKIPSFNKEFPESTNLFFTNILQCIKW